MTNYNHHIHDLTITTESNLEPAWTPITPLWTNPGSGTRERKVAITLALSFQNSSQQALTQVQRGIINRCGNCGREHRRIQCGTYGVRCLNYNRMNHYMRMCRSAQRVYTVQEDSTDRVFSQINDISSDGSVKLKINIYITFKLYIEVDVNVLPKRLLDSISLKDSDLTRTSCNCRVFRG